MEIERETPGVIYDIIMHLTSIICFLIATEKDMFGGYGLCISRMVDNALDKTYESEKSLLAGLKCLTSVFFFKCECTR